MSQHLLKTHYGGWRASPVDPRDRLADHSGIKIQPEVDPRDEMPGAYDQLALGACTGEAVAGVVQYNRRLDGLEDWTPSVLDIYWGERFLEGSPADEDTGAYGRDGFKWAHSKGVIPQADWPYNIQRFAEKPPEDTAHRYKIGIYRVVQRRIQAFKAVLSNRQTVAVGFKVYESFDSDEVARTGIMPLPRYGESVLGGHEVVVVGYLKSEPMFALVRNSWGTDWGLSGYFLMPWAVLLDPRMSSDFRTLYRPLGA